VNELLGNAAVALPPALVDRLLLISAKTVDKKLNDPSYNVTLASQYEDLFSNLTGIEYFDFITEEWDPAMADELKDSVSPDAFLEFTKSSIKGMVELLPQGYIGEDALGYLDDAKILAQEKDASLEAVFERDDFYEELVRRSVTPEETARKSISFINGFTLSKITNVVAKITAEKEYLLYDYDDYEATEMEDFITEIAADPEFKTQIRKVRKSTIGALKTVTKETIVRFWGESALDTLSPEVIKALS
jgi:hypothetical protein